MLRRYCPRKRKESTPRTGWQLERVQQLKVIIKRREELEVHAEKRKTRFVDANFGSKPPATKPPPLQSPRLSNAAPKTLPASARAFASAASASDAAVGAERTKEKKRRKDESDQEEETEPADDHLQRYAKI